MTMDRPAIAFYRGASIVALARHVDGYEAEEHKLKVRKTTYPVESGRTLVDHAVKEPYKLKLRGWVSDLMPSAAVSQNLPLPYRGSAAWRQILQVMDEREPITVITTLGAYENMLIVSATAPIDRTTGNSLRFTIELEEMLLRTAGGSTLTYNLTAASGPAEHRLGTSSRGRVHAPAVQDQRAFLDALSLPSQLGGYA